MNLNKEEKELLASVERGEWRTIPNFEKEAKRYQEYAKNTMRKIEAASPWRPKTRF